MTDNFHRDLSQFDLENPLSALNRQSKVDRSTIHAIPARDRCISKGQTVAKGKNSKKETKKPKKEKPKVSATAGGQGAKPAVSISGSK